MSELNDQQDTVSGAEGGENQPNADQLQQKLTAANEQTAEAKLYARMMADPEFRQILEARAAKKPVKIVVEDGGYKPSGSDPVDEVAPEPAKEPDLEGMSNKELFQHFLRENAKATQKLIQANLRPVVQGLEAVQGQTAQYSNDKAAQEVAKVRDSYPDFDKHADTMIRLNAQHPKLGAKQLYLLAKAEAGEPVVEARQTSSERPGGVTTRPPSRNTRKNPLPAGMMGLRQAIREAASRLPASGVLDSGLGEDEVEVGD